MGVHLSRYTTGVTHHVTMSRFIASVSPASTGSPTILHVRGNLQSYSRVRSNVTDQVGSGAINSPDPTQLAIFCNPPETIREL